MKKFAPFAAFLIPLAIYLSFPTRAFYWDGIAFAMQVERAAAGDPAPLAHANHLIYNYAGYGLFRAASFFFPGIRALWLLQGLNSVLAALAALLIYRLARREDLDETSALCVSSLFAFSATWWRYAVDSDAYITAVFLLLCAWSLLRSKTVPAAVPALVHAAAMLFHQLAFLFFPVALYSVWRRGGSRRRAVLIYAGIAGGIAASAYAVAYRLLFYGRPGGFRAWVTDHAPDARFSFNPIQNLAMTLVSNLRLLFGGKLGSLQLDPVSLAAVAALAAAIAVLLFAKPRITEAARGWWRSVRASEACAHLSIWILTYLVFLFFWLPKNPFYRLFYWPAAVLLIAAGLRPGIGDIPGRPESAPSPRRKLWVSPHFGLAALVAIVALWNFLFMVYPDSRPARNETMQFARAQHERWAPGTGVVFATFHPDLWTLAYFNPQVSWIGMGSVAQLQEMLERFKDAGGKLWLEATAYDALRASEEGRRWLETHVDNGIEIRWQTPKHGFRFHACR